MSGIYIHIPFCKQACYYCDFHFSTSLAKKEAMLNSLKKEVQLRHKQWPAKEIETIYFGGGTPSILKVTEIQDLIHTVHQYFNVTSAVEITLEANPDDLSEDKLQELSKAGINRLSIGIQSFFDEDLRLMNRIHSGREARLCLENAKKLFDNISIDLIYGIPNMSNERWMQNIQIALNYGIPHISSYALTVEPRTALKSLIEKGEIPDIDEEQTEQQFLILQEKLDARGLIHYEISNFGKPGYFSRNNTAYWQGKAYLGIGPSAHSYDGETRYWNVRNNAKYIRAIDKDQLAMETEILSTTDRYNEYVMTRLRTIWGVSLGDLTKDFGERYRTYLEEQADRFLKDHLLYLDDDVMRVTKKGKFLVDGIASHLFMLNLEK